MAKLESSLKNMFLSLTFITLGASALLAGGYAITKEPIERADKAKKENAIKAVLPDKGAVIRDAVEVTLEGKKNKFIVYPAEKNGKLIGAAVQTYSTEGYGGQIEVMVGLNEKGSIVNYSVLSAAETPGLGSKIVDWFKTEKNNQSIIGRNPATKDLKLKKDGGSIDAITASTISSRAFLDAIQDAFDAFMNYRENHK